MITAPQTSVSYSHWFSNDLPYVKPMQHRGIWFPTPVHFYQAMKTNTPARREEIAGAATPALAKHLGGKVAPRPDWTDDLAKRVMRVALDHRVAHEPLWVQRLVKTNGEIVETNNWHDCRWGRCECVSCGGSGTNWFGQILMDIRADLKVKRNGDTSGGRVVSIFLDPYDEYIGRAGKGHDGYFGNPVTTDKPCPMCGKRHVDAGSTLPCYRSYAEKRVARDPEFKRRLLALHGRTLGCFCAPKGGLGAHDTLRCHGQIMLGMIEEITKANRRSAS